MSSTGPIAPKDLAASQRRSVPPCPFIVSSNEGIAALAAGPIRPKALEAKIFMSGSLASSIVSMGIVCALFMALMSMVYLQHVPGKADLERLERDLRDKFGPYLSAAAKVELAFLEPENEGRRLGVEVKLALRQDLRKRPPTVDAYLLRIARRVLDHPEWRGKIDLVRIQHTAKPTVTKVVRAPDRP